MRSLKRHAHTLATELVQRFRDLRVLVIGDAILDTYLEGKASRLCSEGPVPVVCKTAEYRLPGGAANVAANVSALGADVIFLSVVGRDSAGSALRAALCERGVSDRWLIEDETIETVHKLRICADGQYVVRFDEGVQREKVASEGHATSQPRLLAALEEGYERCDLVIVSDYCYGVCSDALIECLCTLHTAQPKILLVDSKALQRFRDVKATIMTPNEREARLLVEKMTGEMPIAKEDTASAAHSGHTYEAGQDGKKLAEVEAVGWQLLSLMDAQHIAITLAEHGVFLLDREGDAFYLPAHPVAHAHDVGAGDSFSAALALALAAGGSIEEAVQIGIDAASIAISRQRTALVPYQELLQRVSLREYAVYATWRAAACLAEHEHDARAAVAHLAALLDAERLAGRTIVFTNGVFDILHAGHVQLLRRARELGDILVVGINSDNSTRRLKGSTRPINNERDRMALVAALDVVDHVALFDEDTPCELIRQLRPHIHVKGGDYADGALPEAEAVREGGGRVVIVPLAGSMSTSGMIERIVSLASDRSSSAAGNPGAALGARRKRYD